MAAEDISALTEEEVADTDGHRPEDDHGEGDEEPEDLGVVAIQIEGNALSAVGRDVDVVDG